VLIKADLEMALYSASTIKAIIPVYLPVKSHELDELWSKLFKKQIAVFKKHIIELTDSEEF